MGGHVGDDEGRALNTAKKVQTWAQGIKNLAAVAESKPQAHYRCLTVSAQHWPTFYQRAVKTTSEEFAPIEEAVRFHSLPAITDHKHRI